MTYLYPSDRCWMPPNSQSYLGPSRLDPTPQCLTFSRVSLNHSRNLTSIFPIQILTPSYEGFLHPTPERLICDFVHDIYVLERKGDSYEVHGYPLEKISCVGVRTLLLDAYIKIYGMTKEGKAGASTLRFNAVTDTLFEPLLASMRQADGEYQDVARSELEKFESWSHVNYKFMMCARRSLLGGEKVLQALLQPEICLPRFALLGKTFYRTVSSTNRNHPDRPGDRFNPGRKLAQCHLGILPVAQYR